MSRADGVADEQPIAVWWLPVQLCADRAGLGAGAICNDFEQKIAYQAYTFAMQQEAWRILPHQSDLDLPQEADIRINDTAAVIIADADTAELVPMRWSFPPTGAGRGPVFNFRSEGRSFANSRRCLAPASAFFEFTDPADPKRKRKDKWRFARLDGQWMALAGICRPGQGNQPPTFSLLTCAAGPDITPIHKRQIIPLPRSDWRDWLALTRPETDLLRPTPAGVLAVERA